MDLWCSSPISVRPSLPLLMEDDFFPSMEDNRFVYDPVTTSWEDFGQRPSLQHRFELHADEIDLDAKDFARPTEPVTNEMRHHKHGVKIDLIDGYSWNSMEPYDWARQVYSFDVSTRKVWSTFCQIHSTGTLTHTTTIATQISSDLIAPVKYTASLDELSLPVLFAADAQRASRTKGSTLCNIPKHIDTLAGCGRLDEFAT